MNRIRNIFGKVNTFVRGSFNYVLGYGSEDEDEQQDQNKVRDTIVNRAETKDAVELKQKVGHSKSYSQVKRKKKRGKEKKKKTKRNKTPSKIHSRQKKITVKIPERPQPFNTGNLFKVPSKSHTQIDCSIAALSKQSDELLISEQTINLDNAIKYGKMAEAIVDVRDEVVKQTRQRKEQAFLPSIVKQQTEATDAEVLAKRADTMKMEGNISRKQNKTADGEVLAKRADTMKMVKEGNITRKQSKTTDVEVLAKRADTHNSVKQGNILPLRNKKDEIKKPSAKEFKPKIQDTKSVNEHELGRQEDKLKLPDIHSCQGSLVSQPISCSNRLQPMAMAVSKKPTGAHPSLLTVVQKGAFLSRTLETIQENVEEKYFNSQSLSVAGRKKLGNIAEYPIEGHKCSDQETSEVSKRNWEVEASNPCLAHRSEAVQVPKNVSQSGWKKTALKDENNVQAIQCQDTFTLERHAVKKKSKKQKGKNKTSSKVKLNDVEAVDSLQDCAQGTGSKLNPIVDNGKSPLERLREVESKLLAQKHLKLGKVFSRNNKVAPLRTDELGGLKKLEVKNDLRLGDPLKKEKLYSAGIERPTPSPAARVPVVLPTPSALPRILPRCQSPKMFNKTANKKMTDSQSYSCATPNFSQFTYEPSDDEEEEQVSRSRIAAAIKTKRVEFHSLLSTSVTYEPSDEDEHKDNLAQATTPKRKFSLQDRLRMGKKVVSSDKDSSKYQVIKTDMFSKPTARGALAGLKASTLGLPRSTDTVLKYPSTSRYSTHHQEKRNILLPSLDPRDRNSIAKKDDLKILDFLEFEDGNE